MPESFIIPMSEYIVDLTASVQAEIDDVLTVGLVTSVEVDHDGPTFVRVKLDRPGHEIHLDNSDGRGIVSVLDPDYAQWSGTYYFEGSPIDEGVGGHHDEMVDAVRRIITAVRD